MRIVNAKLYEEQIRRKMWEIWYDEKYQYYFGGNYRRDFSLQDTDACNKRAFAIFNRDELIGYISYFVDNELKVAYSFGAINFSDDIITFGKALRQIITDCFIKFGMEVVEWDVVCGNPIEASYDRMCDKLGGSIVGIRHCRAVDLAGNVHDDKIYEILRKDFLENYNRRNRYEETKLGS